MDLRLIVMRHAKASHGDHGSDHARPLTERGQRDADRMAKRLVALGWVPGRVLCSDSTRTLETWTAMRARMPANIELLVTPRLYGASFDQLREVLAEQPNQIETLMAIGHNPGWEHSISRLSGQLTPMGTASAALLSRSGGSWSEEGQWRLTAILHPGDEH